MIEYDEEGDPEYVGERELEDDGEKKLSMMCEV